MLSNKIGKSAFIPAAPPLARLTDEATYCALLEKLTKWVVTPGGNVDDKEDARGAIIKALRKDRGAKAIAVVYSGPDKQKLIDMMRTNYGVTITALDHEAELPPPAYPDLHPQPPAYGNADVVEAPPQQVPSFEQSLAMSPLPYQLGSVRIPRAILRGGVDTDVLDSDEEPDGELQQGPRAPEQPAGVRPQVVLHVAQKDEEVKGGPAPANELPPAVAPASNNKKKKKMKEKEKDKRPPLLRFSSLVNQAPERTKKFAAFIQRLLNNRQATAQNLSWTVDEMPSAFRQLDADVQEMVKCYLELPRDQRANPEFTVLFSPAQAGVAAHHPLPDHKKDASDDDLLVEVFMTSLRRTDPSDALAFYSFIAGQCKGWTNSGLDAMTSASAREMVEYFGLPIGARLLVETFCRLNAEQRKATVIDDQVSLARQWADCERASRSQKAHLIDLNNRLFSMIERCSDEERKQFADFTTLHAAAIRATPVNPHPEAFAKLPGYRDLSFRVQWLLPRECDIQCVTAQMQLNTSTADQLKLKLVGAGAEPALSPSLPGLPRRHVEGKHD